MQVVGLVLRALARDFPAVKDRLARLPQVEVAIEDPESGTFIVVITDEGTVPLPELMTQVQLMPGVQSCSLAYEAYEPSE